MSCDSYANQLIRIRLTWFACESHRFKWELGIECDSVESNTSFSDRMWSVDLHIGVARIRPTVAHIRSTRLIYEPSDFKWEFSSPATSSLTTLGLFQYWIAKERVHSISLLALETHRKKSSWVIANKMPLAVLRFKPLAFFLLQRCSSAFRHCVKPKMNRFTRLTISWTGDGSSSVEKWGWNENVSQRTSRNGI